MFFLAKMKDMLPIEPRDLMKPREEALRWQIDKKYVNRIIKDVGLCVSLHEVISIGESFVLPGDSRSMTNVVFNLIVFEPFIEEILVGTVVDSDEKSGIRVSLEKFFGDVYIPPSHLRSPSRYSMADNTWMWEVQGNEMPIELGRTVALRIVAVEYKSDVERAMRRKEGAISAGPPAMKVVGSFLADGLGPLNWWTS